MFEPVTNSMSLRDRIVQDVLTKVENGELVHGDKLPAEREMAVELNVSRTTVRDALRTLAALGVVSIQHGRGIFIQAGEGVALGQALWLPFVMGAETVSHLFEVRKTLETSAAGWAAQRATDKDREALISIVAAVRKEADNETNVNFEEIAVADQAFHTSVLTYSKNPVATRIMLNLLDVLVEARRHSLSIPGRALKSIIEHEMIAEAIFKGDVQEAEKAMLNHLSDVEREILRNLDEDRRNKSISAK